MAWTFLRPKESWRPGLWSAAGWTALAAAILLVGAGSPGGPPGPPKPSVPEFTPPANVPETNKPPPDPHTAPSTSSVLFGLDVESLQLQAAAGVQPDYATIWIGPWNLEKGWLVPDTHLDKLRKAGITPAIHLYYWGDDISPSCVENGCRGKNQDGWDRLTQLLADHLNDHLQGAAVLIILETEFNKASVARYEPLDGLLADKANALRASYPAAQIVLGLGNWNPLAWETWDQAANASDAIGLQALFGSSGAGSADLFNATLDGARRLQQLFGKPLVLDDLAVPSGPAPATAATQAFSLGQFIANTSELEQVGVTTVLYRAFVDNPKLPLTHYFGEAERHYGLTDAETGQLKPAGVVWLAAMQLAQEQRSGG